MPRACPEQSRRVSPILRDLGIVEWNNPASHSPSCTPEFVRRCDIWETGCREPHFTRPPLGVSLRQLPADSSGGFSVSSPTLFSSPRRTALVAVLLIAVSCVAQDVLTYHNNNARTGVNNKETILTTNN